MTTSARAPSRRRGSPTGDSARPAKKCVGVGYGAPGAVRGVPEHATCGARTDDRLRPRVAPRCRADGGTAHPRMCGLGPRGVRGGNGTVDDGTLIGAGKADFTQIYDRPDPRAYYATLGPLDYRIPELAPPGIDAVVAAVNPH